MRNYNGVIVLLLLALLAVPASASNIFNPSSGNLWNQSGETHAYRFHCDNLPAGATTVCTVPAGETHRVSSTEYDLPMAGTVLQISACLSVTGAAAGAADTVTFNRRINGTSVQIAVVSDTEARAIGSSTPGRLAGDGNTDDDASLAGDNLSLEAVTVAGWQATTKDFVCEVPVRWN